MNENGEFTLVGLVSWLLEQIERDPPTANLPVFFAVGENCEGHVPVSIYTGPRNVDIGDDGGSAVWIDVLPEGGEEDTEDPAEENGDVGETSPLCSIGSPSPDDEFIPATATGD